MIKIQSLTRKGIFRFTEALVMDKSTLFNNEEIDIEEILDYYGIQYKVYCLKIYFTLDSFKNLDIAIIETYILKDDNNIFLSADLDSQFDYSNRNKLLHQLIPMLKEKLEIIIKIENKEIFNRLKNNSKLIEKNYFLLDDTFMDDLLLVLYDLMKEGYKCN